MIRFEQVTRRYEAGGRPALDDVTVEFYRGDFAFLIGASGSGKSTLLRMILREGLPQRGKVTVAGQNLGLMLDRRVPDFRRSIGMVFQDFRLLPDKTVFDNVAFAMRVLGTKRSAIRKRVTKVLEKVDLAHLAKRYPHEISGGEQQRAAIARAIVNGPAILLADEPTGNLDPRASAEVMKVLRWINASGTTVIMATHDRAIVDQANSRVVQLHRGRLVRDEPHGFYDAPEGSEAWEVLAQEEGESGLRAHDPAPLKTGMLPVVGSHADAGGTSGEAQVAAESDDQFGGPGEDQVPVPGEDPSVISFDEDPVLQETAPAESAEELEGVALEDPAPETPAPETPADDAGHGPVHEDDHHWARATADQASGDVPDLGADDPDADHEHPATGEASDETLEETFDAEPDEHEHAGEPEHDGEHEPDLQVTWPDRVHEDAHGHDVPEPHGDFNGTEMPDLDQDGYAETEDESGVLPTQPFTEEPATGELPAAVEPPAMPPHDAEQPDRSVQPVEHAEHDEPLEHDEPVEPAGSVPLTGTGHAPAAVSPVVPTTAATRPRLSWLAHADDVPQQQPPPTPQPNRQTQVPRPFAPQSPESPESPGPLRPEQPTTPAEAASPTRPATPEDADQPGSAQQAVERQATARQSDEPPRLPEPKSSASQSTYSDARRTAEHLGIPRSRRSIMRRLRRDR